METNIIQLNVRKIFFFSKEKLIYVATTKINIQQHENISLYVFFEVPLYDLSGTN